MRKALRQLDPWDGASVLLLATLSAVALTTFQDYGSSWDETNHMRQGAGILVYFRSGMQQVPDVNHYYGGGFNILGALVRENSTLESYTALHLLSCFVGLLGALGTWKLGRLLGGPATGFWSLLFVGTFPSYYGQMFNSPKDIPFAAGYAWALYYLARVALALPKVPLSLWIRLSVGLGCAMAVRIGGLMTLGYLVAVVGIYWVAVVARERALRPAARLLARLGLSSLGVAAGAWFLMIAPWPWSHAEPFTRPLASLTRFSKYRYKAPSLYAGELVPSHGGPPWHYLPRYFGIQLQELVVLLLVVGALLVCFVLGQKLWRRQPLSRRQDTVALLVFAILFPPVYAIAKGSTYYDGVRHFLFLSGPLCVAAALSAMWLIDRLRSRHRHLVLAAHAALLLLSLSHLPQMFALHPYQYVYYNRFVGGVEKAYVDYETEYYAHSFKEMGEKLVDYLWQDPSAFVNERYYVMGCMIQAYNILPHLPPNFRFLRDREKHLKKADFYVAYRRKTCPDRRRGYPTILTVKREGVVLNKVRDMRGGERRK